LATLALRRSCFFSEAVIFAGCLINGNVWSRYRTFQSWPSRGISRKPSRRARRDPAFREALLREALESLLAGDVETGNAVLRDYINATIGFKELSRRTRRPSKSLMRMFGRRGNPRARNLFGAIRHLLKEEGVRLKVQVR
jgi:hypothetical protein